MRARNALSLKRFPGMTDVPLEVCVVRQWYLSLSLEGVLYELEWVERQAE